MRDPSFTFAPTTLMPIGVRLERILPRIGKSAGVKDAEIFRALVLDVVDKAHEASSEPSGENTSPSTRPAATRPRQRSVPEGSSRVTSSPSMSPTATTLPSGLSATALTTGWMPPTAKTRSAVTGGGLSAHPASKSATAAARIGAALWRISIHCKG